MSLGHGATIGGREQAQVAKYWWRLAERGGPGFWQIPGWEEHKNLLASGRPDRTWLDVFAEEIVSSGAVPGLALSLGSGGGGYEPMLLERGLATQVEACDLSPDLVAFAQRRADANGLPIRYFVADLNAPRFPSRNYSLILAAAVLHHIEELELLLESLADALAPDGHLFVYDYVGPSRFQWRDAQVAVCNEWLKRIPRHYRRKRGYPWHYRFGKRVFDAIPLLSSGRVESWIGRRAPVQVVGHYRRLKWARLTMDEVIRPPLEQFLVTDPSEAIRSEEIVGLVSRYFQVERTLPLGATLAQPLFGSIAANFTGDADGGEWVARILDDERRRIQSGGLPSDLIAIRARRR